MPTWDPDRINLDDVERAAVILRRGGLVAFPTETVYGLGARALDASALRRIFVAKGRPTTHPLIAHVLGEEQARALAGEWSRLASRFAEAFWPGPLTLVVPRGAQVPLELTGGGDSVGIRAPSHRLARALLACLGEPIAAPSANRYQTVSPTTAAHVAASLGDRVDLILDGGPCSDGIESTVVDLCAEIPVILRPGALDYTILAAVEPTLRDFTPRAVTADGPRLSPGTDRRHYAPRTPLLVGSGRDEALLEAQRRAARGQRVALLLLRPLPDGPEFSSSFEGEGEGEGGRSTVLEPPARTRAERALAVRALGAEPAGYARQLFAALHELDEGGFDLIVAEPVPEEPPWRAIADRLTRASATLE